MMACTGCANDTPAAPSGTEGDAGSGSEDGSGGEVALPAGATEIPEYVWRVGDPQRGRDALIYGSATGSGIPIDYFRELPGFSSSNLLEREGDSADVPWFFNVFDTLDGVTVAAPSCLSCHATRFDGLDGELIVGMGDPYGIARLPAPAELGILKLGIENRYGADSAELQAFLPYFNGVSALIGFAEPPFPGPNAAFAIEEASFAHRDPETLAWLDEPRFNKESQVLAGDVPPWWHLQKKHALYSNGMGRGDAARQLMQSSVLATPGLAHMHAVDQTMPDLLAYLMSIEAPPYPESTNAALVAEGAEIFQTTCSHCHGTYAAEGDTYPNLLIDLPTVGTDPLYAQYPIDSGEIVNSYNEGWFASGEVESWMQAEPGYVAPPLDGIWATAPYFHNGSVPTLAAVLDSSSRPSIWLRDFEGRGYDVGAPGLVYEEVPSDTTDAYDTTVAGYGNGGHVFGDGLSADERAAVVEYLKTL